LTGTTDTIADLTDLTDLDWFTGESAVSTAST